VQTEPSPINKNLQISSLNKKNKNLFLKDIMDDDFLRDNERIINTRLVDSSKSKIIENKIL
jgi:hypothetical protein